MSRKLLEKPLALMQNLRFRTGSLDSQIVSTTQDRSDSSLAHVSDSDEGKENDSSRAVDIGNKDEGSVWYVSNDPVSMDSHSTPSSISPVEFYTESPDLSSSPLYADRSVWYISSNPVAIPTITNPVTTTTVTNPVASKSAPESSTDLLSSLAGNGGEKLSLVEKPSSPEKKVTKTQPKGTMAYQVSGRDSLESIAAHHDTTPSELKKLNRLVSRMIFPGQTLYIPDPDYVSSSDPEPSSPDLSISPPSLSPPPEARMKVDVPLVRMADKPPERVPGHVERQLSTSSLKDRTETEIPAKLTDEQAKELDKECFERFIKINVKHITDGQGVVSGTLIVTPNAVMFDPNVSDPLVIEQGAESYGMITPMDMVISAAMYHDIAAMRLRGKKNEERATSPRPEVYHDRSCPLFHNLHHHKDHVDGAPPTGTANSKPSRSSTLESLKSECSCGVLDNSGDPESPDHSAKEDLPPKEGSSVAKAENSKGGDCEAEDTDTMGAVKSRFVKREKSKEEIERVTCDENDNSRVTGEQRNPPEMLIDISCVDEDEGFSDDGGAEDKGGRKVNMDTSERDLSVATNDSSGLGQTFLSQDDHKSLSLTLSGEEPNSVIADNAALGQTVDTDTNKTSGETRIGSIVYLPVERGSDGTMSVKGGADSLDGTQLVGSDPHGLESHGSSDQTEAGFRPFQAPAKHISNLVNYATGLFRKESEERINVEDINEVVLTTADKTPVMTIKTAQREVESAIKLEDKPELFQTFDKLIARPALRSEDPPLYLCLRVGHPKNKEVSQTCPIESYRTTKKKPEYWFSIPRDKVDQLYAFFVQWTPEIYGDEDDIDPEKRGFVVIEDEEQLNEEQLEIVDEHFSGSIQKIRKDWEIISKEEAIRRMSTIDEPPQLPDMVGETTLLTEEQLTELSQNMPARTIGYTWQLIYSTELHGFSLKTLYRDMTHIDSPILLIVTDTSDNVFGAVTNCAFKISDHFYGTGESFLYTFYPEFKVFHWTGENNFFIKGNKESLAIGAGQGQFGLWLDGDLYHGRSHKCETFDNDVLTDKEDFVLKGLEAWAFL